MARAKSTGTGYWSRTNIRRRIQSGTNGRGSNAAYTSGARSVDQSRDTAAAMRDAWNNRENVQTYTRTRNGRLSDGQGARNARTWTQTNRDMQGNLISQSGRNTMANRRQRDYDVRAGFNNISPQVIEAWRRMGLIDENGQGGSLAIRGNGSGSLGLATG